MVPDAESLRDAVVAALAAGLKKIASAWAALFGALAVVLTAAKWLWPLLAALLVSGIFLGVWACLVR